MPVITLYVARHGQTALNQQRRFQGSTDAPLDAEGLAQAEALAQRLPPDITRIVASPMLRARQTAECVARARGLAVSLMETFCERDYGVFEGLNREDIEAQYAEIWQRKIVQQWDDAPPGGESMRQVRTRVEAGLAQLCETHAGETVLLVAHGFIARMLHWLLNDLPEEQIHAQTMLGNAEFERYLIER
ncbi:histidine phosphatase family protein [Uliginosibacterium sp. H3]|uniref:Histidine phosphatase family protein n=1 Tax=Uliginosibacterium silvisoli TaxID=3114758 RepID=A0ABU6K6X2_9RHOO|nr:histidine phosphatase family protein [Uliginosibacterium sp. H3]